MTYTITKIKTFIGREGHGLNATITKDGKAICFVRDDASGGPVDFDYRNPAQTPASFKSTTAEMAEKAERELGEYCLGIMSAADRSERENRAATMKATYAPELRTEMWL